MGPFITYSSTDLSLNLLSYLTQEWSCLILLFICFSIFNTWKMKGSKKWKRPQNTYHVTWCEVNVRRWGVGSNYKYLLRACFLPGKSNGVLTILWTSGVLPRDSIMKSSLLFECGPLPPYVHFVSTWRHSHDKCFQALPVFCHFSAFVYYTEHKPKNKTQGRLGTSKARNDKGMFCVYVQFLAEVVATVRMVEVPA